MKLSTLMPLALFSATVLLLALGLNQNPRFVPSPLIDRPAPDFRLPDLFKPETTVSLNSLQGQVVMVNVWASWCSGCRREHKLLIDLSLEKDIPIIGLDYKDNRSDAVQWLATLGNPYTAVAFDEEGDTGIDYGVYGVPETYIVDQSGIIRYKHTGPLTETGLRTKILPLIRSLQAGGTSDI